MTDHCPTCDSPNPKLHPAIQHEGEVNVCPDPWHPPVIDKLPDDDVDGAEDRASRHVYQDR